MERVILARHGESEYSVRGLLNGDVSARCPLTSVGVAQAHALGKLLEGESLDLAVTTEFERTRETADEALRGRDVPRAVMAALNDPLAGPFEGNPIEEYRAWALGAPSSLAPGEGESRFAVIERYAEGFREVLERPERSILVVAHSLPLSYALAGRAGDEPKPRMPFAEYATPYPFTRDELERAVEVLERWLSAPTW